MNKKQKERLKLQLVRENELLSKTRKMNRNFLLVASIFIILAIWMFNGGAQDIRSSTIHSVVKWGSSVVGGLLLIMTVLGIITYRNGKRRVLYMIDIIEGKKEFPKDE